jgi:metal-responsive CopG/Arc/MetJ family transcriptional regulator
MAKLQNPKPTKQIGVRLPAALLAELDRYIAERNANEPGLDLTRSDAVRVILARTLTKPRALAS